MNIKLLFIFLSLKIINSYNNFNNNKNLLIKPNSKLNSKPNPNQNPNLNSKPNSKPLLNKNRKYRVYCKTYILWDDGEIEWNHSELELERDQEEILKQNKTPKKT